MFHVPASNFYHYKVLQLHQCNIQAERKLFWNRKKAMEDKIRAKNVPNIKILTKTNRMMILKNFAVCNISIQIWWHE